jgi:uncharacterized protein (TIGR03435 family)
MPQLTQLLSNALGRTVVDKTGLKGNFEFKLEWTPDGFLQRNSESLVIDSAGPSLFSAVQEQLGLRLEAKRGSVEIFVVDGAERPSEN